MNRYYQNHSLTDLLAALRGRLEKIRESCLLEDDPVYDELSEAEEELEAAIEKVNDMKDKL